MECNYVRYAKVQNTRKTCPRGFIWRQQRGLIAQNSLNHA